MRGAPAPSLETTGDGETTDDGGRRRRTTWVLGAVCVVLALVGVAQVVYLSRDPQPTVSAERPVVTGEITHRAAVEAAARATEQILSTSYDDYDAQVEEAAALTTGGFTDEYRELAESVKRKYAQQRMKLQVKAVAQGVVQASPKQVQALLFLNQYVEKVQRGEPATAYSQYRVLVTVVRTDRGWLVSGIDTK